MNRDNLAALPERPRLLVVDDQPANIFILFRALDDRHEVFMATNGLQALEVCRSKRPDLVLLDIEMPGLDGFEICRRLKQDEATADIPVLFVTSHDDPDNEARGLEVGAVDFITKPIHPAVVRARVRTHLTLKWQADRLRDLAFADGLTGVANRRRFDDALDQAWRAGVRSGRAVGLAMVDVDYFKRYNDLYGHQEGDACLRAVAVQLQSVLRRPHDLVARYGGEEFACLVPDCDAEGLRALCESMRAAVAAMARPHARSDCATVVTVSVGCALTVPLRDGKPDGLVAAADAELYAAKAGGRNRVAGVAPESG